MLNKKECVAMLLAGGQGSRLYALTDKVAKPAVSYGAKYKIIDFPLSNCVNSNIDTVGVLTQYQPLELNDYIGNGQPWDLDRNFGGVHILPPYQGKTKTTWYRGTANAVYQNIDFIRRYHPEYVLVLSGDHIYKMDYNKMLEFHKAKGAEATIAVISVPLSEASRFGIMETDEQGRIRRFEEKPLHPQSTDASMGIYIFNTELLYEYLEEDEKDANSENDFGKNVIPKMLSKGVDICAYPFHGYWKDVGTVSSLWEANMDLLGKEPRFDIFDMSWKIYSRNDPFPPHLVMSGAEIANSIITVGCLIEGKAVNSLIGSNVKIGKGATVENSIIFDGAEIREGAKIGYSIIAEKTVIKKNAVIGTLSDGMAPVVPPITVIGAGLTIGHDVRIEAGSMIEKDVKE